MSKLRLGYSSSSLLAPAFLALVLALVTPVAMAQGSSVFNGPRDYAVGSSPNSVVIGDFNGDGRPDIATANRLSNSISVLLQNSGGTFQTAVSYPVGNSPTSLQVGDVNGDGKLDLLLINSIDNTLGLLLGNGDGTFQAQQVTTLPGSSLSLLAAGDFNGDGKTDIAVAASAPQVGKYNAAIMLGNGDGTFHSPVTYSVPSQPMSLATADFNNDGKLDLVSAGTSTNGTAAISLLFGDGDGTFQTAINTTVNAIMAGLVLADFNQDGKLDIATATLTSDVTSNLTVLQGNGDGTFTVTVLSVQALPLAAGDLNGDGKPDIVGTPQDTAAMESLINNGDGTFTVGTPTGVSSHPVVGVPNQQVAVALSDLTGNQKIDLVASVSEVGPSPTSADQVSVLRGNGDGTFANFPSYVVTGFASQLATADFNGDGKQDLGVGIPNIDSSSNLGTLELGTFLNNGEGFSPLTLTQVETGVKGPSGAYLRTADLNSDGHIDVAFSGGSDVSPPGPGVSILLGKGDGSYSSPVLYGATIMGPIGIGDFNNDGKLDVVGTTDSSSQFGGDLSVLLGNGDGTFGFPVTSPPGGTTCCSSLAVGDFNRDGKLDVAAWTSSGVSINLGNGDGTFSAGLAYGTGVSGGIVTGVAFGDLNGDGILDFVMGVLNTLSINQQSSLLAFLGNGDGTFQSPIITLLDETAGPVAVADFNFDGKADVISYGYWYDVSLMLGNGDGTLQAPLQYHIPTQGYLLAVADFDGNGTPDLAAGGPGGVSLLLNATGNNAPAAVLSTAAMEFGNTTVGRTSSAQTVTLTYPGATALSISSIANSGAQSADFSQTNTCGTSLTAGASCTITITFTPQSIGARTASIQITDNAPNSPQIVSLGGTGTAPPSIGFTVPSGGSNSATVAAGQAASYSLSIGGAGMSGSATLTCTGAPQGATCSVSPVTVSGTSASSVGVSVSTTSRTTASVSSRGMIRFGEVWAALLLGLALVPAARRKSLSSGLYLGALVASLLLISSCGGSSSGPKTNPNGTPAGTYKLTVTATLNSTTEDVALQLIVQ